MKARNTEGGGRGGHFMHREPPETFAELLETAATALVLACRSRGLCVAVGLLEALALVALCRPVAGMVVICVCLIGYLRPDLPARERVED